MNLFNSMKSILKKWENFLLGESLNDYNQGGMIRLYHFARSTEPKLLLDPEYSVTHANPYTRKDFNVSQIPRIYFYVNLEHAEEFVKQGAVPYSVVVPIKNIYDLSVDPLDLKAKSSPYPGVPTVLYDKILRSLANKFPEHWPEESLLEPGTPPYAGVFYALENMDVVNWFEQIEVEKFNLENMNTEV